MIKRNLEKGMVSVLLPAYKTKFLSEAISSVLRQTYRNLELIIVDDKSPNDIKKVVSNFNDDRIIYYRNEQNLGAKDPVANWNRCLSYAHGEFFCLLCDDDVYDSHFIENLLLLAKNEKKCNVFRCKSGIITSSGKLIDFYPSSPMMESSEDYALHLIRGLRFQTISEFLYRTEYVLDKGGYVPFPKACYADWFSVLYFAILGGICSTNQILSYFRDSGENLSSVTSDILEKMDALNLFVEKITSLYSDNDNLYKSLVLSEIQKFLYKRKSEYIGIASWKNIYLLYGKRNSRYMIPKSCFIKGILLKLFRTFKK